MKLSSKEKITKDMILNWPVNHYNGLTVDQKLAVWKVIYNKTEPSKTELTVNDLPSKEELEMRINRLRSQLNTTGSN